MNKRKPAVVVKAVKKESRFSGTDWGKVRICGVGIFFLILWCALWTRAYYIQIVRGPELAAMANRQHNTVEIVKGVRGNILDRNGNILAQTVDANAIWVNPADVADKAKAATQLAQVLNKPVSRINAALSKKSRFVWLSRVTGTDVGAAVKALKIKGVHVDSSFKRMYPNNGLAGQLLGFVGVDDNGLEGLEKAFNSDLQGVQLRQLVQRDAAGRRLDSSSGVNDLRGKDVRLTIDSNIQFFAEESLMENVDKYGAKWGGCIVVDVPTGEILAWAQYPFFDPNRYGDFSLEVRKNRLAMDALEQGSTIKSFLIASALEEKVVDPSTVIYCEKGKWKLGRFVIHDTHSYGNLPVSQILHVSSNIGVAKIGRKLGAEKYYSYLKKVGFGERTGLPLSGEAKGILRNYKKWQEIDLATTSFGQSFSATLVQMAQAYLFLASDGMKKPLKLTFDPADKFAQGYSGISDNHEQGQLPVGSDSHKIGGVSERIFSAQTMKELRDMLREVVEEEGGTGKQARIPGMVVGGKTGTAQKADSSGKYGRGRVGSFVGMIPIENPRYLIIALLDEPTRVQYGGVIAAPVFKHVALHTMAYHGLLPDTDDPVVKQIAEKLAKKNSSKTTGKPAVAPVAVSEEVAGHEALDEDSEWDGTLRSNAVVGDLSEVPQLTGLGFHSAVEVLAKHGVMPKFVGKGAIVVKQEPAPGTPWPADKACILWLKERT